MKQEINLYKNAKVKAKYDLTSREVPWVLLAFFIFLFMLTTVRVYNHLMIKKELTNLSQKKEDQNVRLKQLSGQVPEAKTRDQLIADIKRYDDEKKEKEEVLGILIAAQSNKIKGFSGYFDALARETVAGLWLTKFSFKDNGNTIAIEGKSLTPEAVPKLITKLSEEPVFQGKTFEVFQLSLNEETKQIDFTLETKVHKKQP